jgi:hypothetical protein
MQTVLSGMSYSSLCLPDKNTSLKRQSEVIVEWIEPREVLSALYMVEHRDIGTGLDLDYSVSTSSWQTHEFFNDFLTQWFYLKRIFRTKRLKQFYPRSKLLSRALTRTKTVSSWSRWFQSRVGGEPFTATLKLPQRNEVVLRSDFDDMVDYASSFVDQFSGLLGFSESFYYVPKPFPMKNTYLLRFWSSHSSIASKTMSYDDVHRKFLFSQAFEFFNEVRNEDQIVRFEVPVKLQDELTYTTPKNIVPISSGNARSGRVKYGTVTYSYSLHDDQVVDVSNSMAFDTGPNFQVDRNPFIFIGVGSLALLFQKFHSFRDGYTLFDGFRKVTLIPG